MRPHGTGRGREDVQLPEDIMAPARERIERYVQRHGGVDATTAERLVVEALARVGVDVAPGTKVCAGMTQRALQALCDEGRLVKLTRERFAPVVWWDIEEHPDYQLSSTGQVRNGATGRVLRTREDSRGRELVDLGGRTCDVARLVVVYHPSLREAS